jgi:hypothetical protein
MSSKNSSQSSKSQKPAMFGGPSGSLFSKPYLPPLSESIQLLTKNEEEKIDRKSQCLEKSLNNIVAIYAEPSLIKTIRSFYRPGATYEFKMNKASTITTSAAGALQLASVVYPSTMSEYSPLSAIFDECRLLSTRISWSGFSNGTSPLPVPMAVSFDPSNVSTAPTYGLAISIPGVKVCNIFQTAGFMKNSWKKVGEKRPWSLISASGTGTDPVGGVIGTWYFSTAANTTFSVPAITYNTEAIYEFRNPT